MTNIFNISNISNTKANTLLGSFLIGPLEIGQGITLGNSIKRILLTNLSGFAVTGLRINNITHEFSTIEGIREDILEIGLNLKDIIFKSSILFDYNKFDRVNKLFSHFKAFVTIKGPIVVTAGLFHLPKGILKIINPELYIFTIVDNSILYLEIDVENGLNNNKSNQQIYNDSFLNNQLITIPVENTFVPIKNVNYKVKLVYDSKGNLKEALSLEILTNGSISPKRSLQEAIKSLTNILYPLSINPNLIYPLISHDAYTNNIYEKLFTIFD